jgi:dTDP-4-amino-4,6-dideoxygalactose transaminase
MILCANPTAQFLSYQQEIEKAVTRVLRCYKYFLGPEVENLEREFAAFVGTDRAIGVANGTDAMYPELSDLQVQEVVRAIHKI